MLKEDAETERRITNCDVTDRERHLYTSKSNATHLTVKCYRKTAPLFLYNPIKLIATYSFQGVVDFKGGHRDRETDHKL